MKRIASVEMRYNLEPQLVTKKFQFEVIKWGLLFFISVSWLIAFYLIRNALLPLNIKSTFWFYSALLPVFIGILSGVLLIRSLFGLKSDVQSAWVEFDENRISLFYNDDLRTFSWPQIKGLFLQETNKKWILNLSFFKSISFPIPENSQMAFEELKKIPLAAAKMNPMPFSQKTLAFTKVSMRVFSYFAVYITPLTLLAGILLKQNSSDPNSKMAEVQARAERGDCGPAIQFYESIIIDDPKSALPFNNLAWILLTCPDDTFLNPMRALGLINIASEKNDFDVAAQDTMACAYAALGDFDRAVFLAKEFALPNKRVKLFEAKEICTWSN